MFPIIEKVRRHLLLRTWTLWEKLGFYIVPRHFHYPIPDSEEIQNRNRRPFNCTGLNIDQEYALAFLQTCSQYADEYRPLHSDRGFASGGDGHCLYAMVRQHRPERIVEVGSGLSTRIMAEACRKNQHEHGTPWQITCIEPYPNQALIELVDSEPSIELQTTKAQDCDLSLFTSLTDNCMLFIDSSHIVRVGNDVHALYLRILPELQPGLLVHVHDIPFPDEYPQQWLTGSRYFWNEMYLLHMFLCHNQQWRIIFPGNFMRIRHPEKTLDALVGAENDAWMGSFWMMIDPPTTAS